MFSFILLHLYSVSVLKTPTVSPVLPAVEKHHKKIIHKDAFLEKAVKGFMTHNHEIIAIYHELTGTMYDYNRERGKLLPQLNLVGGLKNEQTLSARGSRTDYQNTKNTSVDYGLEAGYVLFDGFSNINGVRAKDFEVQANLYKGLDTIAKKLLDFIQLILTIQEIEFRVEVATRDVQRKEKMHKEAKNRVSVGAASKQDEFQSLAVLNEALGKKGDAELDLKSKKSQFLEWTGVSYRKIPWIAIPEEFLTNFDKLESSLHKKNTAILQAQATLRFREKNQKAINGRLFSPKLELSFAARNVIGKASTVNPDTNEQLDPFANSKNTQMDLSTNLQCKVPLWSGGSDKSEALQASQAVATARHECYSATQEARIAFQNAKESFIDAQNDHQLYTSIVDNYRKSYDISFDQYQNGALSFSDLSQIADRLNRAEEILATKDKERRKTAWELVQILGCLTPSKLCASLDENFDPFSDYNKIKSRI